MSDDGVFGAFKRHVGMLPGVLQWRKRRYARHFASLERVNLYFGIYDSFESAQRSAPPTKPIGYDNSAAAALYTELSEPVASDAKAIELLKRAFADGCRSVFDLGGHTGVKYYAFRGALEYPRDLRWEVCDVAAVTARGAEMARERGVSNHLRFTTEVSRIAEADVLFASGSVQYLPSALPDTLAALATRPRRIIVNRAALHPSRSFFTLNSIGVSFCPYRVQAEPEFRAGIERLGYRCVDRWEIPRAFRVPFEPAYDFDAYVGLAFER